MPVKSNYPNGFPNGVDIRGIPVLNTYGGNLFWVDSGNGSDQKSRGTERRPFATLDYAVGRCTANNGDIILLKAGHAETITADSGVDIDVAGIAVIGLGTGDDRPTFTFTTAVAADFKLAAANTTVKNILFVAGIDALTGPVEISADDCALIDSEYRDDDTNNYETTDVIVTTSTPLRMLIDGFKYIHDGGSGGTQNQSVIQLNGADKAVLRNCHLVADSGTGVIEDATTSDQILIENCIVESTEASPTVAILLTGTTTGTIRNTNLRVASGTTYLTAANDMQFYEVYGTGTDATTGEKVGTQLSGDVEAKVDVIDGYHDVPSADSTDNNQLRDVAGNKTDAAASGAVSAVESLMAYVKQIVTQLGTDADTDPVGAALAGSAGLTTYPAAAAPGNGVSIAEVLRSIFDQQLGTGTDASTNSILGTRVTKTGAVATAADDLFDVTGQVFVTLMYGVVTTQIAGGTTPELLVNVKDGSNTAISGSTVITGDVIDTLYHVMGDPNVTMAGGDAPTVGFAGNGSAARGFILDGITVESTPGGGGAATAGVIDWHLWYVPLEDSATVAAAA